MVYRKSNGEIGALDYREKAPLKATKDMYLDKNGDVIPNLSTEGALAVGVPGTIAGVFAVHKKLGSLPMAEILKPVIALAERGVVVTKKQYLIAIFGTMTKNIRNSESHYFLTSYVCSYHFLFVYIEHLFVYIMQQNYYSVIYVVKI